MLVQDAVKRRQFTQDSDSAGSRRGAGGSIYLLTFPSASQTPSNSMSSLRQCLAAPGWRGFLGFIVTTCTCVVCL